MIKAFSLKRLGAIAAFVAGAIEAFTPSDRTSAQPMPNHSAAAAVQSTPVPVGAHARFSKARINLGDPNLALFTAFLAAGGGAASFSAQKFIADLTGNGPLTQSEIASLTKRFGVDNVASFEKTFNSFVTTALAQATAAGIALPTTPVPDPADVKALWAALYAAGITSRGGFDVEYMLDALVSHVVHVQVMNEIDASPDLGPKADANFHAVLFQLMTDLKTAYKP